MSDWWEAVANKTGNSLEQLVQAVVAVGQMESPNEYANEEYQEETFVEGQQQHQIGQQPNAPEGFWNALANRVLQKHQMASNKLKESFIRLKQPEDSYEEYAQSDLSPMNVQMVTSQSIKPEASSSSLLGLHKIQQSIQPSPPPLLKYEDSFGIARDKQRFAHLPDSIKVAKTHEEKGKLIDFFKNSIACIVHKTKSETQNLASALNVQQKGMNHEKIQTEEADMSPIKTLEQENVNVEIQQPVVSMAKRKTSQKTIQNLKKAIREYQKEDYEEHIDSSAKHQKTNNSSNSRNNLVAKNVTLGLHLEPSINPEQYANPTKSFKISRKNPHQLHNPESHSPIPKNLSEVRRAGDHLNEVKMAYSHAQKMESPSKISNTEESLHGRPKRMKIPKLPDEYLGKFEQREFENSLQSNIEFLLSLKKGGPRDKLVRKQMSNDMKLNHIMKTLGGQSETRIVDKDSRLFLDELKLPPSKRDNQNRGVVRQKPFSIYHPTHRNQLFKLG